MRHLLAAIVICALASGCSAVTADDAAATGDDQNLTESEINGEEPSVFYAQFLYRRDGTPGHYNHHYPSTWDRVRLPSGHEALLSIYMREGGTFTAAYAEDERIDSTESEQIAKEDLSGAWRVVDTKLVLDGIGEAEGIMVDGAPALRLTFERDLHEAGLEGQTALLRIVSSTWGPDGNGP